MNETTNPKAEQKSIDQSLLPLNLVNRLITLLYWVILPTVFLMIGAGAYGLVVAVLSQSPQYGSAGLSSVQQLLTLANSLWSMVASIVLIIILAMLLRWLLFTPQSGPLAKRIQQTLTDVPSLIAMVVIVTVCLLPLLQILVPAVLGNIALVIIGFYFGAESKLRTRGGQEGKASPESAELNGEISEG